MRRERIGFFFSFFWTLSFLSCATGPTREEVKVESNLREIQKLYKPVACFNTDFKIQSRSTRAPSQNGNGEMLGDNEKKRLHFQFKAPYIGIVLSEGFVGGGRVRSENFRGPTQRFTLREFELSGMGQNTIRLPFRLLEDLFLGVLPEEIFNRGARKIELPGKILQVEIHTKVDRTIYQFKSNRLVFMEYKKNGDPGRVIVEMSGQLEESIYPGEIFIQSMDKKEKVQESLKLIFTDLDTKALCPDSQFRTR